MESGKTADFVKIHVLGIGSFFSKRSFYPSIVLEYNGEFTAVDPTANLEYALNTYRIVSGEGLQAKDIAQACITHAHLDHSGGMVDLAVEKYYAELKRRSGERFTFFGPESVLDACWNRMLIDTLRETFRYVDPEYSTRELEFDDIFNLVKLQPEMEKDVGSLEVVAKKGIHASPGGSFGYRFNCGGILIGYSGDTAPSLDGVDDLTKFLSGCDMIMYESGMHRIGGHTSYEFLDGRLKPAERVFLTHYPDTLANDEDMLPFKLLKPGRCYVVTKQGVEEKPITEKGRQLVEIIGGN